MKRSELLKRIGKAARVEHRRWEKERQGKRHEIWICGSIRFPVPRHREINEFTAEAIFKDLETELGKDWWRR